MPTFIGVEMGGRGKFPSPLRHGHPNEIKGKIEKVCPEGGAKSFQGGGKIAQGGKIFAQAKMILPPLTNFSSTPLPTFVFIHRHKNRGGLKECALPTFPNLNFIR